jgi:hypothetical protein
MDGAHQRTGRKIMDLHNKKTGAEPSTPEESITTLEVATQTEDELELDFKTNLCIACSMRET